MADSSTIRRFTFRYVAVLTVLGVLAAINYFTFEVLIANQETSASVLNVAGRQRMLSERIARQVDHVAQNTLGTDLKRHREMLSETISLMERSHEALINGSPEMNLPSLESASIRGMYFKPPFELDRKLRTFLADAKAIAGAAVGTFGVDDPLIRRISEAVSGPLVQALDAVVDRLQAESERRIERLDLAAEAGLAASIIVLLFSAFGVFMPLSRRAADQMKKLTNAEMRLRAILDAAGDGIISTDQTGTVTSFNPAASRMFGYSRQEIIGQNVKMLVPEPHRDRHDGYISNYLDVGESTIIGTGREVLGLRKNGTTFYLHIVVSEAWHDGKNNFVAMVRDITERKMHEEQIEKHQQNLEHQVANRTRKLLQKINERRLAESALRENQERLSAITENLAAGVMVLDPSGQISFANKSAQAMLGTKSDTRLEGQEVDDVFRIVLNGQELSFVDGPLRSVYETGKKVRFEDVTFIFDDGKSMDFTIGCSPLLQHGKQTGVVMSFRDITDLKAIQKEALQASRLASVGQLAAGIAHEINTPIQYIGDNLQFLTEAHDGYVKVFSAYTELLRSAREIDQMAEAMRRVEAVIEDADIEYLQEEVPTAIKQSIDGVGRVSEIVNAMKEFSHPGSKRKEPADLNHAIETTATVCMSEWKHHAEMNFDLDPTLQMVPCHIGELNQVFLNLIVNAAHAIAEKDGQEKGRITISTRSAGDWAEVRIADTGIGMSEKIADRIFDPFFTTKEVGKGTGQGLSISRDVVVKKHGGKMNVTSRVGEGTEFIIRLPLGTKT